jgi:hypothetical protein|tara:strand:+ start:336 stop:599 length:264 start_codon:yes stop_codon:yes gene_type:complete
MDVTSNKEKVQKQFQLILHAGLIRRYAAIPSAANFADDFNLNATGTSTVSRETTRKWINGNAFPEVGHLVVLSHWLRLSVNEIFSIK